MQIHFALPELLEEPDHPCPYCGEESVLDVVGSYVEWLACCPQAHADMEDYPWQPEVPDAIEAATGLEVREVYHDDGLVRGRLRAQLARQRDVFAAIDQHHRHHDPPAGWKWGHEVRCGSTLVGVAVVGRPVSRALQQSEPHTLEVTRVCAWGDYRLRRNACSLLYAACAREAWARDYDRLVTYTLPEEGGASLRAAGWQLDGRTRGGSWDRSARRRVDHAPTGEKLRWHVRRP